MASSSKKIMFFCNVDWFLISHRLNLIKRAVEDGYHVHVVCLITQENRELLDLPVTIHPISLKREGASVINLLFCFFHFLRILQRQRPDILHCITSKPNIIGGLSCFFIKIPRVVMAISGFGILTSDETAIGKIRKKVTMSLFRKIFNRPNISLVVQNPADYKKCLELTKYTDQIHLLMGSGVDLKKLHPPTESLKTKYPPVVLFASRLLKSKGIETFIELSRRKRDLRIEPALDEVEFWVAGKFDHSNPECIDRSLIDSEVELGNIRYMGHVEDMTALLQKASVLILPTRYGEGLPKIICEAASCGVPTIASDLPGCRHAIVNHVTGILIKSSSVNSYFNSLNEVLCDPSKLREMSASARAFAEANFDLNEITHCHFKIYSGG